MINWQDRKKIQISNRKKFKAVGGTWSKETDKAYGIFVP